LSGTCRPHGEVNQQIEHLGAGNTAYERDGETVFGMSFTAEEIDYLDSRAESEARRAQNGRPASAQGG